MDMLRNVCAIIVFACLYSSLVNCASGPLPAIMLTNWPSSSLFFGTIGCRYARTLAYFFSAFA